MLTGQAANLSLHSKDAFSLNEPIKGDPSLAKNRGRTEEVGNFLRQPKLASHVLHLLAPLKHRTCVLPLGP